MMLRPRRLDRKDSGYRYRSLTQAADQLPYPSKLLRVSREAVVEPAPCATGAPDEQTAGFLGDESAS